MQIAKSTAFYKNIKKKNQVATGIRTHAQGEVWFPAWRPNHLGHQGQQILGQKFCKVNLCSRCYNLSPFINVLGIMLKLFIVRIAYL